MLMAMINGEGEIDVVEEKYKREFIEGKRDGIQMCQYSVDRVTSIGKY